MTRAMLLCAGYGSRLGPLGVQRPKPMLPVCDIPILRYGVALLAGHGVGEVVINLHHRGAIIREALGNGDTLGIRIHYVVEDELLGTGGGLKNALDLLDPDGDDEPFLSLNGKLIFDVDLDALLAAYARAPDARGMMVVRRVPDALSWGAVDVDESGEVPEVRDILGRGGFMFGGVHVTRPSVVRRLPAGEACMVRQGYLPWIRAGQKVAAFVANGDAYFAEHSTPRRYLQSNIDLLQGGGLRFPPGAMRDIDVRANIDRSATIRQPVRIGAGAQIGANAMIGENAVIGENATVAAGVRVERAVVWPGVHVGGDLRDGIATPEGIVAAADEDE